MIVPLFSLKNILLPNRLLKIDIDIQLHNEPQMTKTKRTEKTSLFLSVVCFLQASISRGILTLRNKSINTYIRRGYTTTFPTVYSCYLY